jgi:hypothetical protein
VRIEEKIKKCITLTLTLLFPLILISVTVSMPASASEIELTQEELENIADIIVRGRVTGLTSQWEDNQTKIYTYISFHVDNYLKGSGPDNIIIKQLGGTVDEIFLFIPNAPQLIENEEVLLYLGPGDFPIFAKFPEENSPSPSPFMLWKPGFAVGRPPTDPPPFYHWDLREFTGCKVPWSIAWPVPDLDGVGGANTPADQLLARTAITNAFQEWEEVEPAVIGFKLGDFGGALGALTGIARDNHNIISWGPVANPNWLGVTGIWGNVATGVIFEADITLNNSYTWVVAAGGAATPLDSNRDPLAVFPGPNDWDVNANGAFDQQADIQTVAMHEIGHFIGLHHVDTIERDMGPPDPGWPANPYADGAGAVFGDFPGPGDIDDGDGILETPIMDSPWQTALHILHSDDMDGINFLYTPDLGDAPDPPYPSLIHNGPAGENLSGVPKLIPDNGAEHLFGVYFGQVNPGDPTSIGIIDRNGDGLPDYQYEWLGKAIDDSPLECESRQVDLDLFDDGWLIRPLFVSGGVPFIVNIRISTTGVAGRYGPAGPPAGHPLYLNVWFDWNDDGVWVPAELDIWWEGVPGPGGTLASSGNLVAAVPIANDIFLTYTVTPPIVPNVRTIWVRFRLDWAEDTGGVGAIADIDPTLAGPTGAAQFGEVEDYRLEIRPFKILDAEPPRLIDLSRPVCTQWHELFPNHSKRYHLESWYDTNRNGILDPSDHIDLWDKDLEKKVEPYWWHVDEVTITLKVTKKPENIESIYIEFEEGFENIDNAIYNPVCTQWHEVYPSYSEEYHLQEWWDDNDGKLSPSDQIELHNKRTSEKQWYHVDEVKHNILISPGAPPIIGGVVAPVNKLVLLAPWITLTALIAIAAAWVAVYRRRL